MATSISFRDQPRVRPSLYRTPSPPRHLVEAISSHPSPDSNHFWDTRNDEEDRKSQGPNKQTMDAMHDWDGFHDKKQHRASVDSNAPSKVGHSRSGSTIDTLATIALATSPTFASPTYTNAVPYVPPPPIPIDAIERPLKRARSEKSPSPSGFRNGPRPATSHVSNLDSMTVDAELLLNFARPNNLVPRYNESTAQPLANGYGDRRNSDMRWNGSIAPPRGDGWGINAENKSSSAFFASNGISPSRVRSRSDGSAAISRPKMNSMASSSIRHPSLMEAVLEDESDGVHDYNVLSADGVGRKPRGDNPPKETKPRPRKVASGPKKKGSSSEQTSQTKCAACHLVRGPIHGEDQDEVTWVNCDGCNRWFHIVCAGFKDDREIRTVDKFICQQCRPIHGPTTFVRKSSRARTAIDYAGLNQGFVKSSAETPEHHYIQPIKDGSITFLPDNFARLRPELVTSEYFERSSGWKEPVVIPAATNGKLPSFALDPTTANESLFNEVTSQKEFDDLTDKLSEIDEHSKEVVDCGQDQLDMVIPENLTVHHVSDLYGPDERIEVIDVKSQQGGEKGWTMRKWVDYYYDKDVSKTVRNVISLEVSQTPLGRLIRRPEVVRDLDLQDSVWPAELQAIGDYPKVQFYVLMSVADCYTDFHIDFGGSSVFYHILKGKKTFFFIPPKDKHLKKYEEWCNSAAQDTTFLGDQTKECYRVDLSEGDTMLIPSGWIHAVWTPEDSLVIGGNFLTRLNYGMQIKVAKIEKDTKVPRKFRYPFFQKILWYTAMQYLEDDPIPQSVLESFSHDENYRFYRKQPIYYEFDEHSNDAKPGTELYNSRFYSQGEVDGLPDLANYLMRTALIAGGYVVEGVTADTRNAIRRSIPKGSGDPVDTIRKFGYWVAWKRGNEQAATWTRPDAISLDTKIDMSEKKTSSRPMRRSNRNSVPAQDTLRRPSDQACDMLNGVSSNSSSTPSTNATPAPNKRRASLVDVNEEDTIKRSITKGTGLGPKRVACDACRKRRIRCRHKEGLNGDIVQPVNGTRGQTPPFVGIDQTDKVNGPSLTNDEGLLFQTPRSNNKAKDSSPNSSNGKKGRSKACDECRKSKRRCIHDENGRIDPVKAQERSKPRGSTSAKRPRSSDENLSSAMPKKLKYGADPVEPREPLSTENHQQAIKPETISPIDQNHVRNKLKGPDEKISAPQLSSENLSQASYASPPGLKSDMVAASDVANVPLNGAPTASLVSPPTSLADDTDVRAGDANGQAKAAKSRDQVLAQTPMDSTAQTHTVQTLARTSFETARPAPHNTSEVSRPSSKKSFSSRPTSSYRASAGSPALSTGGSLKADKKGAASPASPQRHTKTPKRGSFGDADTDPESLELIRQLQEQEFGLRRRVTRT